MMGATMHSQPHQRHCVQRAEALMSTGAPACTAAAAGLAAQQWGSQAHWLPK